MAETVKLAAGKYRIPVKMTETGGRLEFQFKYNPTLMSDIKVMDGARYHGFDKENPRKIWSVLDNARNRFQLDFLMGKNPYHQWDQPLKEIKPNRDCLYSQQVAMLRIGLTYHYCIWGAEMGTGKTLSAIEVMELSGFSDWFVVAPKGPLNAWRLELKRWKSKVDPTLLSYDELKKVLEHWPPGLYPPHGVIFDESSRCKNHTSQRSQAAQHLADNIRKYYGSAGYVIEMSGSPAPKDPTNWWSQCEIACPGYLREGNILKFRERLAFIKKTDNGIGAFFPKLVTWWDDSRKCKHCGKFKEDLLHDPMFSLTDPDGHEWEESRNEIEYLYRRMKGLVHIFFKKDCLDLPDKRYELIFCSPTQETLNGMKAIAESGRSTIQVLTECRELSDGFQYVKVEDGCETCPRCEGNRSIELEVYTGPDYTPEELATHGVQSPAQHPEAIKHPEWWSKQPDACPNCQGSGQVVHYSRVTHQVECPKDEALLNLLDQHEDVGRIVIYGGFTGTIERLITLVKRAGWKYIKVDGHGWTTDLILESGESPYPSETQMIEVFQKELEADIHDKVAFIGQPGAAGMGITLTASPSIVYYSNDFNGESRIQSEDRIHRLGMDVNRGATIYDLIHLPTDKLVLDNLKLKKDLQYMSMGLMKAELEKAQNDIRST